MRVELRGEEPRIADTAWCAPGAVLVGNVTVGEQAGIWYGAVLRADNDQIAVGARSNLQDGCLVHVDAGHPATVGSGVSVGHGAILHGCTIDDDVLIGMGAIIMNGAHVGARSIVGAGAVIAEGHRVPPGSVILGVPARVRGATTVEQREQIRRNAVEYVRLAEESRAARRPRPGPQY